MYEESINPSLGVYSVTKLLERIEAVTREAPGGFEGRDPEYIHRMRVASRRLRVAVKFLGNFSPLSNPLQFRKRVREITRSLGAARDADVQMLWLHEYKKKKALAAERPGIDRMLLRLRQDRNKMQPGVVKTLAKVMEKGFLETARRDLDSARIRMMMNGEASDAPRNRPYAFEIISLQMQSFLARSHCLEEPGAYGAHHALRIEAKHFRYIMELFSDLYGGELENYIDPVKKLQGYLGDMHDADVWAEKIPVLIEEERVRTEEYTGQLRYFGRLLPGYNSVSGDRKYFRTEQYKKALDLWKELESADMWNGLTSMLLALHKMDSGKDSASGGDAPGV